MFFCFSIPKVNKITMFCVVFACPGLEKLQKHVFFDRFLHQTIENHCVLMVLASKSNETTVFYSKCCLQC